MNLKFSIIMPVYNSEKYIKQAIDSIIHQSYTNWEMIIVNDGSTDKSGIICDEYCRDERIKVFHQENKGAVEARIKAIENAEGDYLVGLDSDDWFEKDALLELYNIIQEYQCDIVKFKWRQTNDNSISGPHLEEKRYSKVDFLELAILYTMHSLSDKAIKMEVIKKIKWKKPKTNLTINADYLQIVPVLCQSESIYVLDKVLYNYRIVESSMSHNTKFQNIIDTDYVSVEIMKIIEREQLLTKKIYDAICIAFLKMIKGRMKELIINKKITSDELKIFYSLHLYIRCNKYEIKEYFEKTDVHFFKLLRKNNIKRIRFENLVFKLKRKIKKIIKK